MPRQLLYSKIMERNMQQTFCLCSCIWGTMEMIWWLRVLICCLCGFWISPELFPLWGELGVSKARAAGFCSGAACWVLSWTNDNVRVAFSCKTWVSLNLAWKKCWGTKELEHVNPQFLRSIESRVPSVTAQRSDFQGATHGQYSQQPQWKRGIPVKIGPWCLRTDTHGGCL